ncbi:MAG: HAD family hydrolase [Thermoleophilaceae bacterium]|nr:HAD family hydrolase [Thermoleophilaceae bacterium]
MAAAILDIDGTLVDTNYHHAIAWHRAFRRHDILLPVWRIHRHIGMGGDQLVTALCGENTEEEVGEEIRSDEKDLYSELIAEVEPMDAARDLIVDLRDRDHDVVLASSAKPDEVEHYIDLLDARELAHAWTTQADVDATKPAPDLVRAALERANAGDSKGAFMVGDSTWDCIAAGRAGIPTLAVLTGGFADAELREAGASAVFESLDELRGRLDELPALTAG